MAKLFVNQAKEYANGRPTYPKELFEFIASKTPSHLLVWDVATGSGQAIPPLAKMYKKVIATDTSEKQLEFAPKLSNVNYQHTCPNMSIHQLQQHVASQSTLDLVTIAQALHWFNQAEFFDLVKWALKKPNGVIAAWCYTLPEVNPEVDDVFGPFYELDSKPYWDEARKLVDNKYMDIYFPFEPVDGLDHTGPFQFNAEKLMDFHDYMLYIRSWSAYNTAKENGVELLTDEVTQKFKYAWNISGDGSGQKLVNFPIYLRIGKVGYIHKG
ncbi:putative methyltransferase [Bienertia sinuspersici]